MNRKIDRLGRIVIPKEIRTKCHLFEGQEIEFKEENGIIIITPRKHLCILCKKKINCENDVPLCLSCLLTLKKS